MINRRKFSRLLFLFTLPIMMGHAPWGQWHVYRMRHMLFLSVQEDEDSYPFSKEIIEALSHSLPEARARPARAKDFRRVHSLLSTDQMPLVVLSKNIALSLLSGTGVFNNYSPVNMSLVFHFGKMLLLARPSMPDSHTWRLTDALIRSGKFSNKINDTEIPVHNGSNIRFMNLPMPGEPIHEKDDI